MNEKLKPVLKWFGYSRRERRSTFILLVILIAVIMIRYTVSVSQDPIEIISDSLFIAENFKAGQPEKLPMADSMRVKSLPFFTGRKIKFTAPDSISLNACDSADLERLPFLGPVLSGRIIKYRNLLGGFVSVVQLKEVYGISDTAYAALSGRFYIDSSLVRQIDINLASFGELLRHPYLDMSDVQSIFRYREAGGAILSADDLSGEGILPVVKVQKIDPYINYRR